MCKFIGKSNERILCKLSESETLRLYSIVHVAMGTTKTSNFTCQSKFFISILFNCLVLACELQPFSCHDLVNYILLVTNCPTKLCSATFIYTPSPPVNEVYGNFANLQKDDKLDSHRYSKLGGSGDTLLPRKFFKLFLWAQPMFPAFSTGHSVFSMNIKENAMGSCWFYVCSVISRFNVHGK